MKYNIDLSKISTGEEFHRKIKETLPCPDYYGSNLDALHDVLTGVAEEWEVTFSGCMFFREALPGYMAGLERLCAEAAKERFGLHVIFEES